MDDFYSKEKHELCYSVPIIPINGMEIWHTIDADELLPYLYKKGSGRAKKLRFRELGEGGTRIRRVGMAYKCTKFDRMSHNSRKCKATTHNPEALKIKVIVHLVTVLICL